jgi:hypothetical protein
LSKKTTRNTRKAIQESAWVQFLFTLKFWMEDGSAALRKTDIYIEKSVKLSFDLMNITINSLIDFGKFIFKEKHKKINENNRLYSNIQN